MQKQAAAHTQSQSVMRMRLVNMKVDAALDDVLRDFQKYISSGPNVDPTKFVYKGKTQ